MVALARNCRRREWIFPHVKDNEFSIVWNGPVKYTREQTQATRKIEEHEYDGLSHVEVLHLEPIITFSCYPHGEGACQYFYQGKLVATLDGKFQWGLPVKGKLTYEGDDNHDSDCENKILFYEGGFERGYEYGTGARFHLTNGTRLCGDFSTKELTSQQQVLHTLTIKFTKRNDKTVAPIVQK